jgi:ABC-2 type transport system permease protein
MMKRLARILSIYAAIMTQMPKIFFQYSAWFWAELFGQGLMMGIAYAFWQAVYASASTVGGLTAGETIHYILLAALFAPIVRGSFILNMGGMVRQGTIAIELLRPADFQARMFTEGLAFSLTTLVTQGVPLTLFAVFAFGLRLPTDPRLWGAFLFSYLLGFAVLFCFEWCFACLAFYTTEAWGLHVLREGVASFFSGLLVPLAMLPSWLQTIAKFLPFGQSLYVPVSLLSGLTPLSEAPRLWGVQLLWLAILLPLSRLIFSRAVRTVTVQGG